MAIYRGDGGANEATDLATNQAVVAKSYAEQAAQSATEVEQVYNEFLDIYLGDFTTNPTTDNQGDALQVGALYFNSTDKLLRVYDGTTWLVSAISEPSSFSRNWFDGDGSTVDFVLSTTPVNEDSVFVFVSGVLNTDYTVTGMTLTFGTAPASGTNNVLAVVASTVSTLNPADNSVSTAKLQEGAVTSSKLADLNVTEEKIADGAITTNKLESVATAATVGSVSAIPIITYDAKGRVTGSSTASVTAKASSAQAVAGTNDDTFLSPLKLVEALQSTNQSLGTNGFQKFPGGLVLQWGVTTVISAGSSVTVTLPTSFPNHAYVAVANPTMSFNNTNAPCAAVQFSGTSQLIVRNVGATNNLSFYWVAIGD